MKRYVKGVKVNAASSVIHIADGGDSISTSWNFNPKQEVQFQHTLNLCLKFSSKVATCYVLQELEVSFDIPMRNGSAPAKLF